MGVFLFLLSSRTLRSCLWGYLCSCLAPTLQWRALLNDTREEKINSSVDIEVQRRIGATIKNKTLHQVSREVEQTSDCKWRTLSWIRKSEKSSNRTCYNLPTFKWLWGQTRNECICFHLQDCVEISEPDPCEVNPFTIEETNVVKIWSSLILTCQMSSNQSFISHSLVNQL